MTRLLFQTTLSCSAEVKLFIRAVFLIISWNFDPWRKTRLFLYIFAEGKGWSWTIKTARNWACLKFDQEILGIGAFLVAIYNTMIAKI